MSAPQNDRRGFLTPTSKRTEHLLVLSVLRIVVALDLESAAHLLAVSKCLTFPDVAGSRHVGNLFVSFS